MTGDKNGHAQLAAGETEWITGAELARRMKVKPPRITALYNKGILPRDPESKKYDFELCAKIMEGGRSFDKSRRPDSVFQAKMEAETYKALILQLDYEERLRNLLPAEEVARFCSAIIMAAKTRLLNIPSKVAPLAATEDNPRVIKNIIDKEITAALNELSKIRDVLNK